MLVQRMRPRHTQAPCLLNCYAESQVKNLLCFWKALGWMREKGKQREKSESMNWPTEWWWKWISCENSWRAEFWEGINERGTKTTSPEYEPQAEMVMKSEATVSEQKPGLGYWILWISETERLSSLPAEPEIIFRENFLQKREDCLTPIVKPDSLC